MPLQKHSQLWRVDSGAHFSEQRVAVNLGDTLELSDSMAMRLSPAGHILGSAQVTLTYNNEVATISGDYKRAYDPMPAV